MANDEQSSISETSVNNHPGPIELGEKQLADTLGVRYTEKLPVTLKVNSENNYSGAIKIGEKQLAKDLNHESAK